jgi:uncharacterized protein YdaU (DUF1376 family)
MHYYQFNIGDYKSHTEHLSEMEDLTYRRLLDWYYLHESPIPLEINEVARQIRMRSHTDCIAVVLQEYFERTNDGWIHHRADKEIAKAGEKSTKASQSAKARWEKKSIKNKDLPVDANALQMQSKSNATQDTRHITQNTKKKVADAPVVLPNWIPLETWQAFLEMRKKIKKPATEKAVVLLIAKLDKFRKSGQDVQAILEKSIVNDWQDIYELKELSNKSFAQQAADIARTTVPAANRGPDPALVKIEQDRLKAVPPTLEQLERMAALRRSIAK